MESLTSGSQASQLIEMLNYFHPVSPAIASYLDKHTFPAHFRKGKFLLQTGAICGHVYYIIKGAVRGFIYDGQHEITTWITADHEMVTSISGFDPQLPSIENIQAIEDCDMLAMTYNDIQRLYELHPEFNITIRKVLERYYRDAEGRALIGRLNTAESRYVQFLKSHDRLVNRIPQKYIASYLGIAEETLSRVRKKMSRPA